MSTPRSIGSIINRSVLQLNGLNTNLHGKKTETVPQPEFMHPILTRGDIAKTMELYNQHIKKYNMEVWIEHKEIRKFNREVIRHRRKITLTKEQKIQEFIWKEEHRDLEPAAYNAAVEAYNLKNGPQFRKVNIRQEVKTASEKYFMAFLYQYNSQLFLRKKFRADLNVHVNGSLPKLEIYPNKIVEAEKNGCRIINASIETVRHHRERLQEAGVFTDYSYHGPNRPVKIAINPEILSLTDNGKPSSALDGNQSLMSSQTKKVPHNNVSSSLQSLEESKSSVEGDAANASSSSIATGSSTRTPRKQGSKKIDAPGKNLTAGLKKNKDSAALTDKLDDAVDFCRDLAAGKYENYSPLNPTDAKKEAYYGAMHPEDFKELAVQDVFKYSASLFSDLDVHPGSWMNAYKIWCSDKFLNFDGKNLLSKPNLLARWQKCIEVLRRIKKYQAKHGWIPMFPSKYFDTARTAHEHNSFEYAFKNFRLDAEKAEPFQKRKVLAGKSLRYKTDVEKARVKIRQYLKGKATLDDVYEYVRQNCDSQVWTRINNIIKKEFETFNA